MRYMRVLKYPLDEDVPMLPMTPSATFGSVRSAAPDRQEPCRKPLWRSSK